VSRTAERMGRRVAGWALVAALGWLPVPGSAAAQDVQDAQVAEPGQAATVTLTEYRFDPATVVLQAGVETHLTVVNRGTVLHEFATPYLTDLEVSVETGGVKVETLGLGEVEVPPGGRAVLVFTPEAKGSFIIVCGADKPVSHLHKGMRGMLEVR